MPVGKKIFFEKILLDDPLEEEAIERKNTESQKENEIDIDLEKRRVLAFRDYCETNDLPFQRIIVKSTSECAYSITNDGYITFRKNIQLS